jgi:ribonuclease HI
MTIEIFTDGSSLNNQQSTNRQGGIGVYFGEDDCRNISKGFIDSKHLKVTNQVAELFAAVEAIKKLLETTMITNNKVIIYTDSMYLINSITKWAKKWEKNNWKKADNKPVENLSLIKKLYFYSNNINVEYKHVNSHKPKPKNETSEEYKLWHGNNKADELATTAAKKMKNKML